MPGGISRGQHKPARTPQLYIKKCDLVVTCLCNGCLLSSNIFKTFRRQA